MRVQCLNAMLFLGLMAPSAVAEYVTLAGRTFGTSYMVKVIDARPIETESLDSAIRTRFAEIDQRMSTYRDDSEVSRFNQASAGVWFSVSEETAKLVQRAVELSRKTQGAFDVTVGPAVALWEFGAASTSDAFHVPADELVDATQQRIGFDKLVVQREPPALKKLVGGLEIDLSAIAKGYAVDAIARLLDEYPHYMVEIGGEVRTKGSRDLGHGWRIGLEAPTRNQRRVDSIITLNDQALATSGDYRNYHIQNGVVYSHTIDPKTARPVQHQLASVTVLAEDCTTADALATALLVMGPERARAFAEENHIRALLVLRDDEPVGGDPKLTRVATQGFPADPASPSTGYFQTFLITAAVFGIALFAMSIGTIFANRRLQGSCGGMAGLKDQGGNTICDMCTKPSPECSGQPSESGPDEV